MVKRVEQLGDDYVPVKDRLDREALLEGLVPRRALRYYLDRYPSLFVRVGDAEVLEVWGVESEVVYLEDQARRIFDARALHRRILHQNQARVAVGVGR